MAQRAGKNPDGSVNDDRDYTAQQMAYILHPWGRSGTHIIQSLVIRTQGAGVFLVLKRTEWESGAASVAFVGASTLAKGLQELEEGLRLNALKWKEDKYANG